MVKCNYRILNKSCIPVTQFLENQVEKNCRCCTSPHAGQKRKTITFPYAELVTNFLTYTIYQFRDEEPEFMHTKIWQVAISKMGYTIQGREGFPLPRRRGRQWRNNDLPPSSSITSNDIHNEQREMNGKFNKLVQRMERRNLISPTFSSKDDDNEPTIS